LDHAAQELHVQLIETNAPEIRARWVVERMALVLQAALLIQHADSAVADAFCASRLDGHAGGASGMLPPHLDLSRIISRARPAVPAG
jgi:putative acyl-CoA dehydrogenase